MALTCKNCGYRTQDDSITNCPRCGRPMGSESEPEEAPARAAGPAFSGIRPYIAPLILIVLVLAALVFLLSQPKGSSLFENIPTPPASVTADQGEADAAESGDAVAESGDGAESGDTTEPEAESTSGVATDPSGNEILTDTTLPGLDVQPEYVLADSARHLWTVTTKNDALNMRSGPDTSYTVLGKLSKGTQVVGCGYSSNGPSNWIVVEYNGQYGWACTDYMTQN